MIIPRRQFVFLTLGAVLLLLSGFPASAQSANGAGKPAKPAKQATAVAETVAVKEIDAAGLATLLRRKNGRPLLVNFWATWCEPCREEFPDLIKIDADYRSQGLDFFLVSLDDIGEINAEVPKFLREMGATMPSYLLNAVDPDPAIKLVDPNWGGALPATVLYDKNGQIAFKHFGRIKPAELRAAIQKVMSKDSLLITTP